jgi:N-acetyl-gamma-glutamyl-phosphate reductase
VHQVHPDLLGDTGLCFTGDTQFLQHGEVDVLFLCLGHGESDRFLKEHEPASTVRIIDLANDHRLIAQARRGERTFIYGLPELNRDLIRKASSVANPGCFATTLQLGLLPLAAAGLLEEVYTTGITGSTGAGQSLTATSHFSWRYSNIQAYKTLTHQHLGEIMQSLRQLQTNKDCKVHFVPWRGDFTRGIFISSQLRCSLSLDELYNHYEKFYQDHPFTHVTREALYLKQVVNTNKCIIQLEKAGDQLVVHSVADNLLKGACGQAVQNMNLMFGMEESLGLDLKAVAF